MSRYSQRDPRWANLYLGTSKGTIGAYGCAITALGNIVGKTPAQVNTILRNGGAFLEGNLVIWAKACQLLGLEWLGQSNKPTASPTIAQVRGSGFPMHFVVWMGGNKIIDSWDGKLKINPYLLTLFDNVRLNPGKPPVVPAASGQVSNKGSDMITRTGLNVVFRMLLGRAPDASAIKHYVNHYSFDFVYKDVKGSTEYRNKVKAIKKSQAVKANLPIAIRTIYKGK